MQIGGVITTIKIIKNLKEENKKEMRWINFSVIIFNNYKR